MVFRCNSVLLLIIHREYRWKSRRIISFGKLTLLLGCGLADGCLLGLGDKESWE